jgi:hypothetical protein
MPSTDIDGSPILIIGRKDGELIAGLLEISRSRFEITPEERSLADRLKATFGIDVEE